MPRSGRSIAVGERELEPVVERLTLLYASRKPERSPVTEPDAVWCIGETLAACGGYDLMWIVFQMVEERCGEPCATWLDRAWDGVAIPGLMEWCSYGPGRTS
jgi:hypothetical protein